MRLGLDLLISGFALMSDWRQSTTVDVSLFLQHRVAQITLVLLRA